ncbi:MAG: GtrA family protein [Chitinispirillaceae bacterium]
MTASTKKTTLFLISAGAAGLIYLAVLHLLVEVWKSDLYIGVAAAYLAAMSFYFLINKLLIFGKTVEHHRLFPQILKFALMLVANYLITYFLVWLFERYTGEVYSGSIAAGIVTTLVAYLVFSRIFR